MEADALARSLSGDLLVMSMCQLPVGEERTTAYSEPTATSSGQREAVCRSLPDERASLIFPQ